MMETYRRSCWEKYFGLLSESKVIHLPWLDGLGLSLSTLTVTIDLNTSQVTWLHRSACWSGVVESWPCCLLDGAEYVSA